MKARTQDAMLKSIAAEIHRGYVPSLDKQIARARKRMGEERWQQLNRGGINDRRTPRNRMSQM